MLVITWNLRTSTDDLPLQINETKEAISLNANVFLLKSVFPKAERQGEKIITSPRKTLLAQHRSSKFVFPTVENH